MAKRRNFSGEFKFDLNGVNDMSTTISIVKKIYRTLVPASVRNSAMVTKLKERLLTHEWIYDSGYYESVVEGPALRSAAAIANSIINDMDPKHIIDVGCGTGALLETLRNRGCEVFGLEYSEAALQYCRSRHLNVQKFDLEKDVFNDKRAFDVAISMEVAEHLPKTISDRYIDLLTHLSQVVVFTAAAPGQEGSDHINLQPASYWITKFQQRGFKLLEEISQRWRANWKTSGNVEGWYYQNLMVFRRTPENEHHTVTTG